MRYPFGDNRNERRREEDARAEVVAAVADMYDMSTIEARRYLVDAKRSSLLPLSDWRNGLPGSA